MGAMRSASRIAAASIAAVALVATAPGVARAQVAVGQPAPELAPNVQISGERVGTLEGLRGKVVFLNFFATW